MSNTSNLGLAQGFMQGFNFMEGVEDRKQMRGLRENQERRADEAHGLRMEQGERAKDLHASAMELHQVTMDNHNRDKQSDQRDEDARLVNAMHQGVVNGNIDPAIANEFAERYDVDWSNYVNPEFGESLAVLERAVMGDVNMSSPQFRQAFGTVFAKEIGKNVGEETADGNVIKEKRLRGVYPSPDGQGIVIDLDIFEEGESGGQWRSAPVTENRSASDEDVKTIPLDAALEKLKGHQLLFGAVQNSPQLKAMLKQYAARAGSELPDQDRFGDVQDHPEVGLGQFGPDGRFYQLKDPRASKAVRGINIDGRLVDPTTGEGIGPAGQAGGLSSEYDGSIRSQIDKAAKSFHGTFNPDGSFLGFDEKAREGYVNALQRTAELYDMGVPLYDAIHIANLSTIDKLTPEKAETIAIEEADNRDLDGDAYDRFVQDYSRQLLANKNKAHQMYEQLMLQKNAPQTDVDSTNEQTEETVEDAPVQGLQSTKQAPPKAIAKYFDLIDGASEEEVKKTQQFFLEKFGYLPTKGA